MFKLILKSFLLILIVKNGKTGFLDDLKQDIRNTRSLSKDLVEKYGTTNLTVQQKFEINRLIFHQKPHDHRHKKGLNILGVSKFEGFEKIANTTGLPFDILDSTIFLLKFQDSQRNLFIALSTSKISIYQLSLQAARLIASYSIQNALGLSSVRFNENLQLIAVQHSAGISIFRARISATSEPVLDYLQTINIVGVKNVVLTLPSETAGQLFLSVSRDKKVQVYLWLEKRFVLSQVLSGDSGILVALSSVNNVMRAFLLDPEFKVLIYEYSESEKKFVPTQKIVKPAKDATVIHDFLGTANQEAVFLYRKNGNVFESFQKIPIIGTEKIFSVAMDGTILLLLLKGDEILVYQFNGWRFVELDLKLNGVKEIKLDKISEQEILLTVRGIDDFWNFYRFLPIKSTNEANFLERMNRWCIENKRKAEQKIQPIVQSREPVRIFKANINKLRVKSINGLNLKKLNSLLEDYRKIVDSFGLLSNDLQKTILGRKAIFKNLFVKKAAIRCKINNCQAFNLKINPNSDVFKKLRRVDDVIQNVNFQNVRTVRLKNFPCPKPGLLLEEVEVGGLVGHRNWTDLLNNLLRTTGNQVIDGALTFDNLNVTSLRAPRLEVASTRARRKIIAEKIQAVDLMISSGHVLLPLDSDESIKMTGIFTTSKVKLENLMHVKGAFKGKGMQKFKPVAYFDDPLRLNGNYTLRNVDVTEMLETTDLKSFGGDSFKEFKRRAIPLNAKNISMRLNLINPMNTFQNVFTLGTPNWLLKNNSDPVIVTGTKIFSKTIVVPKSTYSQLPMPKINARVCALSATTMDVKTSSLAVGEISAELVETINIIGAKRFNYMMNDAVTEVDDEVFSQKLFQGPIVIENLQIKNFENSPIFDFERLANWSSPYTLRGPVKMQNLTADSVHSDSILKMPVITKVDSLFSEANLQVKTINEIDIDKLKNDIIRTTDDFTSYEMKFDNLVVDEVTAENVNMNLEDIRLSEENLGIKKILGDLIIEGDLKISSLDSQVRMRSGSNNATYVIEGSLELKHEPIIQNLNNEDLEQLMNNVWMLDRPTVIKHNMHFANVTLIKASVPYKLLKTPAMVTWESFHNRVFSKSKIQEIKVPSNFMNSSARNIATQAGNYGIRSKVSFLNDLMDKSLKMSEPLQIVTGNWHFDNLVVTDRVEFLGLINDLNLSTDVARRDSQINKIIGKKVINGLIAKNVQGLNFDGWVQDALTKSRLMSEHLIFIRGRKTFAQFFAKHLTVYGLICGKNLQNLLLKYGDQTISGKKRIEGSVHASELMILGLINRVNVTDLTKRQMKRHESIQEIRGLVEFDQGIEIFGNVTIGGNFGNVKLEKLFGMNETLEPVASRIESVRSFAESVKMALDNRAVYWKSLVEIPQPLSLESLKLRSAKKTKVNLVDLGQCTLKSHKTVVCCDDRYNKQYLTLRNFKNNTPPLMNEILVVENFLVVVQIVVHPQNKLVFQVLDTTTNSFQLGASIPVPEAIEGSALVLSLKTVWAVVRCKSEMLVIRYEIWGDVKKFALSYSSFHVLDIAPLTNEVLLFRDDGVWRLEGLSGPQLVLSVNFNGKVDTYSMKHEYLVRLSQKDGDKWLKSKFVNRD